MTRFLCIGGDDMLKAGLQREFRAYGLEMFFLKNDLREIHNYLEESPEHLIVYIVSADIAKADEHIHIIRNAYRLPFLLAVAPNNDAASILLNSGADTVLTDKEYWAPLLAQIKSILRRISYNKKTLVPGTSKKSELDVLDISAVKEEYGCDVIKGKSKIFTRFKYFCPRAERVTLKLFSSYDKKEERSFKMLGEENGDWALIISEDLTAQFYAYEITANGKVEEQLVADPYSKYLTTTNDHLQHPLTRITDTSFDWEGDTWVYPERPTDLVIYETHIKDFTGEVGDDKSVYEEFINTAIPHLKELGVNCVELLPLQKSAYIEPPYSKPETKDKGNPTLNSWNPYEKNYWGYMTTGFFAPETVHSKDGSSKKGYICGTKGLAINEFKELVKALHKEGITVIMDVVYNHISNYDLNPLRLTDEDYYLRKDEHGNLASASGCGNDFKSESEKARELIIQSVLYWMKEYHIDGFRFDLAHIIDWKTIEQIRKECQFINPNVILIAEPWGGGYNPEGFSNLGWAAWNDQYRNGIKGVDPISNKGFIFGSWTGGVSRFAVENFIGGTLVGKANGLFKKVQHSINYLESHDGYTLSDFIRIALNPDKQNKHFESASDVNKLSVNELKIAKLAAFILFISKGIPMIHAGQEFGRPKWIAAETGIEDADVGRLDHNSYEKDNETNYLDFELKEVNKQLFNYYKELISLRSSLKALRSTDVGSLRFLDAGDDMTLMFSLDGARSDDKYDYLVLINARPQQRILLLPEGDWEEIANHISICKDGNGYVRDLFEVPATSGFMFRKCRD